MGRSKPTHAENTALRRISRSVPAADFQAVLDKSSDPRASHLLGMLLAPEYSHLSLPAMCEKAGLYYDEVLLMLTRGRVGDGIEKMSRHAPKVFDDIGVDAESTMITCPECKGTSIRTVGRGKNAEELECWTCSGTGKLRKVGDVDARKLMMESLGLTNKNKGASIQVNVGNTGVRTVEDDLELTGEVIDVVAQPQSK
jgi:hypothetical protein